MNPILKTLQHIFLIILLLYISLQGVFGASGDSIEGHKLESLREMSNSIDELEKKKIQLEFQWEEFRIGNEALGELIRDDLLKEEKNILKSNILIYGKESQYLELKISELVEEGMNIGIKKVELIQLKKDFYKDLIPYIENSKLAIFLEYVNSDLVYREKGREVSLQINQQSVEREERIEKIRLQIDQNTQLLREKIQGKIIGKIESRLDIFISREKFSNLSNEVKIRLFQRIIGKLSEKKLNLKETNDSTNALEEKIILFDIIEDILQKYIEKWI